MKIMVTEQDIAMGKRGSCDECPVALAVKRRLPGCSQAAVCDYVVTLAPVKSTYLASCYRRRQHFRLTLKLKRWIHDFDRGRPVKPGTFNLPEVRR